MVHLLKYINRFEIQRYESDEGYFFQNSKNYLRIGISEIFYDKINDNINLATITFGISNKYYSYYKKSYQKILSLLADIMNIVNILILTGKIISNILLKKNE